MRLPVREPAGAGQTMQMRMTRRALSYHPLPMPPLAEELRDARARLLELVADLDDARWMGPRLPIVNPIRWEIAHVAWFQERWVLRHARNEES